MHDLPAGATRLVTPAVGLHGVWVNCRQIAKERGLLEGEVRPDQVLRDFAA